MASLSEHRIEFASYATRALETAGGDGRPGLVLLHGWGESADTYRPLLDALQARGRRAIAVDLPSASQLAPGPLLPQLDAFAMDLVSSWAGEEPVVVAGNSLGGCLALRLAEHPGEVRLAGVVPVAPDGLEMPSWFDPIEQDPIVRKLLATPLAVPRALLRGRPLDRSHPRVAQRAVVDMLVGDGDDRLDVAELLESGRRLAPELSAAPFDLIAVRCPVLLVWGEHDATLPQTVARVALDSLPLTQVELIPGCGGAPQLEAPGRLLELLLPFPG
jgi:pimeloyl-ACP methyl ester carboxylesterase